MTENSPEVHILKFIHNQNLLEIGTNVRLISTGEKTFNTIESRTCAHFIRKYADEYPSSSILLFLTRIPSPGRRIPVTAVIHLRAEKEKIHSDLLSPGRVIARLNIPCRAHLFLLNTRRKTCTSTIKEIRRRPENMCEKRMELFITDLLFA